MNIGSLLGCALSNQLIQSFSSVSSFPSTKLGVGYQDIDEDTRSDQEGENDHERRRNTEEGKVFTDSIGN